MDRFLESMRTPMLRMPLWAWIAALVVGGFILTAMDDRPRVYYETCPYYHAC